MIEPADPQAPKPATLPLKLPLKERLKALFAEYGQVAVAVYLTLSLLTIAGFSLAFGIGWEPTSASGVFGVIFAGWIAAKATAPIRILITLALTPMVSLAHERWRLKRAAGKRDTDSAAADDSSPPTVE